MATVIICSRSNVLRRNLASMLTRQGHHALETDGTIALISACLTRRVDMIMIDEEQEYLSAAAAIRCLRCNPLTAGMPIIAMGLNVHTLRAAISAGANQALVTPIETRALLRTLDLLTLRQGLALPS